MYNNGSRLAAYNNGTMLGAVSATSAYRAALAQVQAIYKTWYPGVYPESPVGSDPLVAAIAAGTKNLNDADAQFGLAYAKATYPWSTAVGSVGQKPVTAADAARLIDLACRLGGQPTMRPGTAWGNAQAAAWAKGDWSNTTPIGIVQWGLANRGNVGYVPEIPYPPIATSGGGSSSSPGSNLFTNADGSLSDLSKIGLGVGALLLITRSK